VLAGNCTELATELQAVLDKCPSAMAKRWLVLRVRLISQLTYYIIPVCSLKVVQQHA